MRWGRRQPCTGDDLVWEVQLHRLDDEGVWTEAGNPVEVDGLDAALMVAEKMATGHPGTAGARSGITVTTRSWEYGGDA